MMMPISSIIRAAIDKQSKPILARLSPATLYISASSLHSICYPRTNKTPTYQTPVRPGGKHTPSYKGAKRLLSTRNGVLRQEHRNHKYDMTRERIVNSIQTNPHIVTSSLQYEPSGPSWKTVFVLVVGSSTFAVLLYVFLQIYYSEESPNNSRRSVFLPLRLRTNIVHPSRYIFPAELTFFDGEFSTNLENYIGTQFAASNDAFGDYIKSLQDDCITYQALHGLSMSDAVRDIFGLPLNKDSCENFDIWIESDYPTISGLQIEFDSKPMATLREKLSSISFRWTIKPINLGSSVDDFLVSVGLKLDTINRTRTADGDSGRIQEAHISDVSAPIIATRPSTRPYCVKIAGDLQISDMSTSQRGILHYQGIIDPDHILIQKGVKLQIMVLEVYRGSKIDDKISYKIK